MLSTGRVSKSSASNSLVFLLSNALPLSNYYPYTWSLPLFLLSRFHFLGRNQLLIDLCLPFAQPAGSIGGPTSSSSS